LCLYTTLEEHKKYSVLCALGVRSGKGGGCRFRFESRGIMAKKCFVISANPRISSQSPYTDGFSDNVSSFSTITFAGGSVQSAPVPACAHFNICREEHESKAGKEWPGIDHAKLTWLRDPAYLRASTRTTQNFVLKRIYLYGVSEQVFLHSGGLFTFKAVSVPLYFACIGKWPRRPEIKTRPKTRSCS
jgi:hypothetical protein